MDDPRGQRQPLREEDEEDADVEAAVDGRPVDLVRDHQVPHHLDRGRVEREHGDDVQDFARVDAAPAVMLGKYSSRTSYSYGFALYLPGLRARVDHRQGQMTCVSPSSRNAGSTG